MIYYYNIDNPLSSKDSFGFDGDYRRVGAAVNSNTTALDFGGDLERVNVPVSSTGFGRQAWPIQMGRCAPSENDIISKINVQIVYGINKKHVTDNRRTRSVVIFKLDYLLFAIMLVTYRRFR